MRINKILMRGVVAAFLIVLSSTIAMAQKPDFAYPQKVEKNASAQLARSIREKDQVGIIQSMISLVITNSMTQPDSIPSSIRLIRSANSHLTFPYDRLGLLIEADYYQAVYNDNRFVYGERTLPEKTDSQNPLEWSADDFATKVQSLLSRAYNNWAAPSEAFPLSDISPLLIDWKDAAAGGWTVKDFVAYTALNIASDFYSVSEETIPFFPEHNVYAKETSGSIMKEFATSIAENWAKDAKVRDCYDAYGEALVQKSRTKSGSARNQFLWGMAEKLHNNPVSVRLYSEIPPYSVSLLYGDVTQQEYFLRASDALSKFPESGYAARLRYILDEMKQSSVDLKLEDSSESNKPISAQAIYYNTGSTVLNLYKLPNDLSKRRLSNFEFKNDNLIKSFTIASGKTSDGRERTDFPYSDTIQFSLPGLDYGLYTLIPASVAERRKRDENVDPGSLFYVTDINGAISSAAGKSNLYVFSVDGMIPVAGAKVDCYSIDRNRSLIASLTTNNDGQATLPDKNCFVEVLSEKGKWFTYHYPRGAVRDSGYVLRGNVLLDRAIAHPGDSVEFSVILYNKNDRELSPAENVRIRCELLDANSEVCDSVSLTTDLTGRAAAGFKIPSKGLLGSYSIRVLEEAVQSAKYARSICAQWFEVAEYKRPTFVVTLNDTSRSFKAGENVVISGKVTTWSGVPVENADIKFTVATIPYFWRSSVESASFFGQLKGDEQGNFKIVLPTDALKNTPYANANYRLQLNATSSAGETQELDEIRFTIGEVSHLVANVPNLFEVESQGKILKCRVAEIDAEGNPVERSVTFTMTDSNGKTVESGSLVTPEFLLNVGQLRSGLYHLNFNNGEVEKDLVIISGTEGRSPAGVPLWIPKKEVIAEPGADETTIKFGTDRSGGRFLCQISNLKGETTTKWLTANADGMVNMKVASPKTDERCFVNLITTHGFKTTSGRITVLPASERDTLKIEVVSFRNKLIPGSGEEWTFKVKNGSKNQGFPSVMAVMTDKSLNTLAPLRWVFNPRAGLDWSPSAYLSASSSGSADSRFYLSTIKQYNQSTPQYPEFDFYGMSLYGQMYGRVMFTTSRKYMSAKVECSSEMNMSYSMSQTAMADDVADAGGIDNGIEELATDEIAEAEVEPLNENSEYRESECPVAFFRPMIVGNEEGDFALNFRVPDFNTTWSLQIVAYNQLMSSASLTLDAVASKPLMLSLNVPRFLRTGDKVEFVASVFNNSGAVSNGEVLIELLDRVSNKTLKSETIPMNDLPAEGSRIFSMTYDVDDKTTEVIVRAKVSNGEFSDGEQTALAVLPAAVPVVDSCNFYLNPGEKEYSMSLPELKEESNVTFTFCNNPVWYCINSLSSSAEATSENMLSIADSYYSNSVAAGLTAKNPQLRKAIAQLFEGADAEKDTFFESRLTKNSQLSGVEVASTPWVNNAADERLRQLNLAQLLNTDDLQTARAEMVKQFAERQDSEGFLSWMPGMSGSPYITRRVLGLLGNLNRAGYLDNDPAIKKLVKNAVKGLDRYYLEERKRAKGNYSLTDMIDYLLLRSDLSCGANPLVGTPSGEMGRYAADVVKRMSKEWKTLGLGMKAKGAMLLQDAKLTQSLGNTQRLRLQKDMLTSLEEFSVDTPDKGIWYPSLKRTYGFLSPVAETATVLEAFARCTDNDKMVNGLRQWLILQRQISDWGDASVSVTVVNAILSSGIEWLSCDNQLTVKLNGRPLQIENNESLTGSVTIDINPKEGSMGELTLERDGSGPAWGGVISQYVQPIREVNSQSVDGLKVSRKLYRLDEKNGKQEVVEANSFKPGDKVRVAITLEVSDNMSYVVISDLRSAAMEPAEQLSGMVGTEAGFAYREIRGTETNFYFTRLVSGTHIITYDCYVAHNGEFSGGLTKVVSAYAPTFTSRSAGSEIRCRSNR